MAESLRHVAEEVPAVGVDLFAVEADVVGEAEQLLHQLGGGIDASGASECLGEPERARQERALGVCEAVLTLVAANVGTVGELAPDRVHGLSDSLVTLRGVAV